MGEVSRAFDIKLGMPVVFKKIMFDPLIHKYITYNKSPETDQSYSFYKKLILKEFELEAKTQAKIPGSAVVPIYNLIELTDPDNGEKSLIIVMQEMVAPTVSEIITNEAIPGISFNVEMGDNTSRSSFLYPEHIISSISDIAHAIESMAKAGIFHQDIKPANIFVEIFGETAHGRITDFGISNMVVDHANQGTAPYLPFERLPGNPKIESNIKSELCSLGMVVLRMVTNLSLYRRSQNDKDAPLYVAILNDAKETTDCGINRFGKNPDTYGGKLQRAINRYCTAAGCDPTRVTEFFNKVLSVDMDDRPASADEFIKMLEHAFEVIN